MIELDKGKAAPPLYIQIKEDLKKKLIREYGLREIKSHQN